MAEYLNLKLIPSGAHPQGGVLGEYSDTLLDWAIEHTDLKTYAELLDKHFGLTFIIRYSYNLPFTSEQYLRPFDYEKVYDFNFNMRIYQETARFISTTPELINSPYVSEIHLNTPRIPELELLSQHICDMFKSLSGHTLVSYYYDRVDAFSNPTSKQICGIPIFSSPTELEMKLKLLK